MRLLLVFQPVNNDGSFDIRVVREIVELGRFTGGAFGCDKDKDSNEQNDNDSEQHRQ
ncbi:hypothetical protein D3C75_1350290 [compost metagenome]